MAGNPQRHVAGFQQLVAAEAAAILEAEIEAADCRQFRDRRHVDGEHHGLLDAEKGHVGSTHHGGRLGILARALVPVLEADEGDRRVLAATKKGEAGNADHVLHFLLLEEVGLRFLQDFQGALARCAGRELDHADEVALVLVGQEAAGQFSEQPAGGAEDREVDDQPAPGATEHRAGAGEVAFHGRGEAAIEHAQYAVGRHQVIAARLVLEQSGAQGRRQRQGEQRREAHGQHQGDGELTVDGAGGAAEEGHRHEHGRQHQGDGDDGADDLVHGLARGFAWRQVLLAHDALDVFDDHNGIVNDDADRQHHGEQGQHIDRVAEEIQPDQAANQGHRHDNGRDESGAQVAEEDVHHQEDQGHGLGQGLQHFADRDVDEARGIVGDHPGDALGEVFRQFGHALPDRLGGVQCVGTGRHAHGDGGRRLLVGARGDAVVLGAKLDAGNVLDAHRGARRVGFDDDLAEFLGRREA